MEERKHFITYLEQVFMIQGISLVVIALICALVGEEAREYSTMFGLGDAGIPVHTVLEYLLSSVCITALRFIFFTDTLIKSWSLAGRTVGMLGAVTGVIGGLSYLFGWFPVDNLKCWVAFFISFGICFLVSVLLSARREQQENQQLERALRKMKESK